MMDEERLKNWASQPDVCRCCLSASGSSNLTASYVANTDVKQNFSEMLLECYGITLSYLSEWGPSHLICSRCQSRLQEANCFRKQVLKAEKYFVDYYQNKKEPLETSEIKMEFLDSFLESPTNMDDEDFLISESEHITTNPLKQSFNKRKKNMTFKCKEIEEVDSDSDVPVSMLLNNNKLVDDKRLATSANCSTSGKRGPQLAVPTRAKQISERKRVILTCAIVLKDTSACPFRHHKSWFQCFFCTEEFMDISTLRDHNLKVHQDLELELRKMKRYPRSLQVDISNLECKHCHSTLIDVESLRHHFELVHDKVIYKECIADYKVNRSPYSCHLCKQEFHVFRTLTTHLNEHYANCICDVCGRSFINSKRLKVHKRIHENGQFPCSECGKILKTRTSRSNHVESVHSKRQLKCQICYKPMKHYNDRIKHMSEVHNITHLFKCNICFKEYNVKHYLATHMRQTHGNKNKKCSDCGMAFITNHGLKKHMSKHTGVKPHKCVVCGKAYARSYTLREHMRAHEGDTRFLCNE